MKYNVIVTILIILGLLGSCQKEPPVQQPQQNCRLLSYGVEGGITLTYSYSSDDKLIGVSTSDGYAYKLAYMGKQADLYRVDKNGVTSTTAVSTFTLDNNGYIVQAKYQDQQQKSQTVTIQYNSNGYLVSQSYSQIAELMNSTPGDIGNPTSVTITSTISNSVLGITTNEFYLDKTNQLPLPFPFYYSLKLQPGYSPFYDSNIITGDLLIGMTGKAYPNLLKKASTNNVLTSTGLGTISYEFTYDFDKDGKVVRIYAINTFPNYPPAPSIITLQYDCP